MCFKFMSLTQTFFLNSRFKTSSHLLDISTWTLDRSLRLCLVHHWPPVSPFQMWSNLRSFVSISVGSGVLPHVQIKQRDPCSLSSLKPKSCLSGNPIDSAFTICWNLVTRQHFSVYRLILATSCPYSVPAQHRARMVLVRPPLDCVLPVACKNIRDVAPVPCPASPPTRHPRSFSLIYTDLCAPLNLPAHFCLSPFVRSSWKYFSEMFAWLTPSSPSGLFSNVTFLIKSHLKLQT